MGTSRRDFVKLIAASAVLASQDATSAQSVPPACKTAVTPNPPSVRPRIPLEEFAATDSLVAALRRGVSEMKKRRPSDPRSWFFQAAIHGVDDDPISFGFKYYKAALARDPDVANVDRKFWNQCPHFGQNSANFLPWHRAYTFHFEQILRHHTGDSNFSLPYWNYEVPANRKFPRIFGVEHLDGNTANDADDNINPLFMKERDFYLTYYEHPLIPDMPILELSDTVVDSSISMATGVFFGDSETTGLAGGIADNNPGTRGLLESRPHDHIHRVVGGVIPGGAAGKDENGKDIDIDITGAMATPPTAGFDPIFPLHHTNIDRLWSEWSYLPGKAWGKLPSASWFAERPWYFFDVDGNCVNEPRIAYFDHRKLGVRFKNEDTSQTPLTLPDFPAVAVAAATPLSLATPQHIAGIDSSLSIGTVSRTALALPKAMNAKLMATLRSARPNALALARRRFVLRVTIADIRNMPTVGFDVHVTENSERELLRSGPSFVGSVNLFVHAHHGNAVTQDFDVTAAVQNIPGLSLEMAKVVFVPFALSKTRATGAANLQSPPLRVQSLAYLVV